jgi:hypothetical protein
VHIELGLPEKQQNILGRPPAETTSSGFAEAIEAVWACYINIVDIVMRRGCTIFDVT